eukprot:GEMP01047980.1.p1 GENE.GEMP01047980.1~~GEMP01047980.1.p1  ORF type:complete len:188 (+),score=44.80 GEMP01047980.1:516-1079(+)
MTVTELEGDVFTINIANESLKRTDLVQLKVGDMVNIERPMKQSDRNSGHVVQGHVDCTGSILEMKKDGDSLRVRIGAANLISRGWIIPKGYIAVDGISLTVIDVTEESFTLMLIAHTQQCVTLPHKKIGGVVNLEADCFGKHAVACFELNYSKQIKNMETQIFYSKVFTAAAVASAIMVMALFGKQR